MDDNQIILSIADIACEMYRFKRVFEKVLQNSSIEDRKKYLSQFNWFQKRVEKSLQQAGLHVVDVEGMDYDPGMAVTPLNLDDFENEVDLSIIQMIEPIVMKGDALIKTGTVMLGRKQ